MTISTKEILRKAGLRRTRQRVALVDQLAVQQGAVTAAQLKSSLDADNAGVGLTTIYRTIAALQDADLVDTFDADGEQAIRMCAAGGHHHHLSCQKCGAVEEIESTAVERWVERVAKSCGYAVLSHEAEIRGLCPSCR